MSEHNKQRVLFISMDGMTDQLGTSQVLPYLEKLTALGHRFTIVSLEKPDRFQAGGEHIREQCARSDILWHPLTYHRSPPFVAQAANILRLGKAAHQLIRKGAYKLVHARGLLPARIASSIRKKSAVPYIFDTRGFWADERIEGKIWSKANPVQHALFRHLKRRERDLFREADGLVMLTERAKHYVLQQEVRSRSRAGIAVIPCCVDRQLFLKPDEPQREEARAALGITDDEPVAVYLGSIGTWYMLDEMLQFFRVQLEKDPRSRLLFITHEPPQSLLEAAARNGVAADALLFRSADRLEVARLLRAADYGLFFIRPSFSKTASSPTKLGELLAVGLPVVTNSGIGDVDRIMAEIGAGPVVERFDVEAYRSAVDEVTGLSLDPSRLAQGLQHWFDLDEGARRYDLLYARALEGAGIYGPD
jgi:glycosyltransferase involved in cell wall biosynthesis